MEIMTYKQEINESRYVIDDIFIFYYIQYKYGNHCFILTKVSDENMETNIISSNFVI
jgi:hypothetical protein